jgi:hypothetical protein
VTRRDVSCRIVTRRDVSYLVPQGRGVLVASRPRHHLIGSAEQPWGYRVNDDVRGRLG